MAISSPLFNLKSPLYLKSLNLIKELVIRFLAYLCADTNCSGSAVFKIGSNLSLLTKCNTRYPPGLSQSKQFLKIVFYL